MQHKITEKQKQNPKFNEFLSADPSSSKKYVAWMCDQHDKGHNVPDIVGTVKLFYDNRFRMDNDQKDIYSFDDLKTIEDILKDMGASNRFLAKQAKNEEQAQFLGISSGYKLYRIDNKAACVSYAKGTRWCIGMENSSYFDQYQRSGNVFVFAIRNEEKFALVFNYDDKSETWKLKEVYDSSDQTVALDVWQECAQYVNEHLEDAPLTFAMQIFCKKSSEPIDDLVLENWDEFYRLMTS